MSSAIRACIGIALTTAILGGCSGNSGSESPTSPTPPAATATPVSQAVSGNITLAAVTHPSGSTLTVQRCEPAFTGIAGDHVCKDDWFVAFDIVLDRDLADVVMTVSLEDGNERCGDTVVIGQSFAAGRSRLVSTTSSLYLTYEPEGYDDLKVTQRCTLPRTTNRMVVQLWKIENPAKPLLQREFDFVYRLVQEGAASQPAS